MTIRKMGLLVLSSLFVSSIAIAAPQEDQEIDKRTCQKWAQEDGIAADKMESYISKCMAELAGNVDQYGGQDAPDGASAPPLGGAAPAATAPAAPAPAATKPAAAPAAPAAGAPAAKPPEKK